jgi:hypothetical protein
VSRSRAQGRLPLVPRNNPREARGGLLALPPGGSVAGHSAASVGEHTLREGSGGYLEARDVTIRVSPPALAARGCRLRW